MNDSAVIRNKPATQHTSKQNVLVTYVALSPNGKITVDVSRAERFGLQVLGQDEPLFVIAWGLFSRTQLFAAYSTNGGELLASMERLRSIPSGYTDAVKHAVKRFVDYRKFDCRR